MGITIDLKNQMEQCLLSALNQFSLKDFIHSQGLKNAFGEFVARGTVQELWCLLPQIERAGLLDLYSTHAPLDLINDRWVPACSVKLSKSLSLEPRLPEPSSELPSSELPPSSLPSPSLPSPTLPSSELPSSELPPSELPSPSLPSPSLPSPTLPSSELPSSELPSEPLSPVSFILQITSHGLPSKLPQDVPSHIKDRVHRVFKTINGFQTPLPQENYEKLWTCKKGIFENPAKEIADQARNLQQGRRRIKTGTSEYDCASRFSLLFLAHFVDHIASRPTTEKMPNGQSRRSKAFKIFSDATGTPIDEVKDDYLRTKRYHELIDAEGPGILLEIGPDMSAMFEKKLMKQDIIDVLCYREIRRCKQRQCADFSSKKFAEDKQKWNTVAANVIIDGLQANGCTKPDFLLSNTPLRQVVAKCLTDEIDSVTSSKKRKRGGSNPVISKNRLGIPQRGRGSEVAERHTSNNALPTPPLDRTTNLCGSDGRMGELLVAAGLSVSSSQEQGHCHFSQEPNASTGNIFEPGLDISSQEDVSINQGQSLEDGSRQIGSSLPETFNFSNNPSMLPGVGQGPPLNFVNDPAAQLGMDQALPYNMFDDPAVQLDMGQELPYNMFDDPAVQLDMGQELPYGMFDDPAVQLGMDQALPYNMFDDPAVQLDMDQELPYDMFDDPAVQLGMGQGHLCEAGMGFI